MISRIARLMLLLVTAAALHSAFAQSDPTIDQVYKAAQAGQRTYAELLEEARQSPVAYVDETGWRAAGHTGFVWTLSTPTARLVHGTPSRAGAVLRGLLGSADEGVVVSDF